MLNRRSSILAMLLILLSILLLFSYGTPSWFGDFTWAIFPLNFQQWKGIWLGAFVHGSWDHLWGNVIALAIFSALFMIQFPKQWLRFWIMQHVLASLLLWLIGNVGMDAHRTGTAHIGASIWVYAFGGFILTAGVMQRTKQSMAIFFMVLLMFGGFFWGLL
ncbi:MAG: rhomboid family intramembrane serine protease, partial [Bacteroidota bacterium]